MKLLATLPLLALLFGCESTTHNQAYDDDFGKDPRVSDDVFVYVPESERDEVDEARAEALEMKDTVDQAQHEVGLEAQRLDIAKSERNNAEDAVETARRELKVARDSAKDDRNDIVEDAEARVDGARRRWHAAQAKVALHEARLDQLKADVALAKLKVDLAEARIELAKAKAVSELDRPELYDLPVRDFEASVKEHETRLKMAEVDVDAWKKKAELRQKAYDDVDDEADDAG